MAFMALLEHDLAPWIRRIGENPLVEEIRVFWERNRVRSASRGGGAVRTEPGSREPTRSRRVLHLAAEGPNSPPPGFSVEPWTGRRRTRPRSPTSRRWRRRPRPERASGG